MAGSENKIWHIVADVNKNAGDIASLKHFLNNAQNIGKQLWEDVNDCSKDLI